MGYLKTCECEECGQVEACYRGVCADCRQKVKAARVAKIREDRYLAAGRVPHFLSGPPLKAHNAQRKAVGLCSAVSPECNDPALPNGDLRTPLCLRHWLIMWGAWRLFSEIEQRYKIPKTLKVVQEIESQILPLVLPQFEKQQGLCYFSGRPIHLGADCALHLLREIDGRRPGNIVIIHRDIGHLTWHRDPAAVLRWAKNFVLSVERANANQV